MIKFSTEPLEHSLPDSFWYNFKSTKGVFIQIIRRLIRRGLAGESYIAHLEGLILLIEDLWNTYNKSSFKYETSYSDMEFRKKKSKFVAFIYCVCLKPRKKKLIHIKALMTKQEWQLMELSGKSYKILYWSLVNREEWHVKTLSDKLFNFLIKKKLDTVRSLQKILA